MNQGIGDAAMRLVGLLRLSKAGTCDAAYRSAERLEQFVRRTDIMLAPRAGDQIDVASERSMNRDGIAMMTGGKAHRVDDLREKRSAEGLGCFAEGRRVVSHCCAAFLFKTFESSLAKAYQSCLVNVGGRFTSCSSSLE